MMRKLILFAALFAFTACDVHFHDGDDDNGYFRVWGDSYWLETATEYYPPVERTSGSDLVRVVFGSPWDDDEPGIELLLWTPPDTGLAPGRYVWDPVTPEPYGVAEGWAWGDDYDWEARIVGGSIEVDRWGHSCEVEFDLTVAGGNRLTGRYRGEVLER